MRITGDETYTGESMCASGCGRVTERNGDGLYLVSYRCCDECLSNHGFGHTKECDKANPKVALADSWADAGQIITDSFRLEDLMAGMVLANRSLRTPHILGERANHIQSLGVTIYYGLIFGLVIGWGWLMLSLIWLISGQERL